VSAVNSPRVSLIDTHAHLDEDAFIGEREEVIDRARAAGVVAMLTIGTTLKSSRLAIELAEAHSDIFAVVGIQPNYVSEASPDDWQQVVELAAHPRVVAIGETGLDRYWDFSPFELQRDYFDRHLDLAVERKLPFIVHCREAESEVIDCLRLAQDRHGFFPGVMHSFCGDQSALDQCLKLGLHISFAGMVTFKRNDDLRAVAARVPDDRLLIETDSPYLAPVPLRGKRNEPANVEHTARCLAEVRGTSFEELAAMTTANARALFGLS
jgi:TatD DNase family protein